MNALFTSEQILFPAPTSGTGKGITAAVRTRCAPCCATGRTSPRTPWFWKSFLRTAWTPAASAATGSGFPICIPDPHGSAPFPAIFCPASAPSPVAKTDSIIPRPPVCSCSEKAGISAGNSPTICWITRSLTPPAASSGSSPPGRRTGAAACLTFIFSSTTESCRVWKKSPRLRERHPPCAPKAPPSVRVPVSRIPTFQASDPPWARRSPTV